MKSLLYKEFKLNIHPLFYLVSLMGVLILIPNWLYFIAMSYVFFITITNIFTSSKAQNDFSYCAMLPIRKKDIVKARIISIIIIELLHIVVAVGIAILNNKLYPHGNYFLEPNFAFFGFVFIMYAIFNMIFFPMFYKTGEKIGIPAVIAIFTAVIFAATVETTVLIVPQINIALDSNDEGTLIWKLIILALGICIYAISAVLSYKLSSKRFEKLDL